jgi:hypothetical protein
MLPARDARRTGMATGWSEIEELLVGLAGDDLAEQGEVHPTLVALTGDTLAFLAFLRPFEKGCYADPMIELLALAMPLGCDRLALSIGGRVWSLEDPIPPVSDHVDLRQRALVLYYVEGTEPAVSDSVLHPFDLVDGEVVWSPPVGDLGTAEGWIPEALRLAVQRRGELATGDAEIRRQAARCQQLGHEVHLGPEVAERLLAAPERCATPPRQRRRWLRA